MELHSYRSIENSLEMRYWIKFVEIHFIKNDETMESQAQIFITAQRMTSQNTMCCRAEYFELRDSGRVSGAAYF